MSVSIPSKQIYSVDVPEVKNFNAKFVYNFYVFDEQVNEEITIPKFLSTKSTDEITSKFNKIFDLNVPRYIHISWDKVLAFTNASLVDNYGGISTFDQKNISPNFIKNNYDKIITEDEFSSSVFVGVTFNDTQLFNKLQSLLKSAYIAIGEIPKDNPDYQLLVTDPSTFNTKYNTTGIQNQETGGVKDLEEIYNSVYINCKINKTLLYDIVNRVIQDPQTPFSDDISQLMNMGKPYKDVLDNKISEGEYSPSFPYVKIVPVKSGANMNKLLDVKVVGYVIDKFSIGADKKVISHAPIILEGDSLKQFLDTRIKYNNTYCYSIRSICAINVPAIDKSTNKISLATFLVSSKPSRNLWVTTLENKAPPYPADTKFRWDYSTNKLVISWCMPVNPQYDIKKFQVFRRKKIEHPFQILREFDFDDSVVKMEDGEMPNKNLIEYSSRPVNHYIDDDFNKNSKFIYTLACVDAHGMTSNYGPQFEISFDKFKNELIQKLVSYPGAPKPYPNLYLQGTGFSNTMKVGGEFSKNMNIYLAPHDPKQRYFFLNSGTGYKSIFETDITKGVYKLQIINLDNQKGETITIEVIDKMSKAKFAVPNTTPKAYPDVTKGNSSTTTTVSPSAGTNSTFDAKGASPYKGASYLNGFQDLTKTGGLKDSLKPKF